MKPFETLTNAGQLHRLRRLALLLHEDNTTFRVESLDGERYVLRIHRPLRMAVDDLSF